MAYIISSPNTYFESLDINKFITKPRVLPRIWKQRVKIEDFWNLGGRKLVTQFTRMIIATLYIDLAKQNVRLYVI